MNQAHHPQKASIKSLLCLCLISTAFSQASPAQAQITPDNTLGAEASRLNQNLIINGILGDKIDGGAIRGSNLFHSFSEFNIENGQRVYFANPTGIENILTRVTGRNASNIFGTLGVDGAANLFLINPNGILFGQNARLDVQGSFVGTTANGVQFGNQGIFSATNPQAPPLLTVNPSALFFNQINQGAVIQNNSIARAGTDPAGFNASGLRVPDGKSLLLVGGNVSMDGGDLNAYGGRVELGGLAAPGNVNLLFNRDNLSLKFPLNVTRASVSLTNEARVSVEAAGGGDIAINARNINILGGSQLSAGIAKGLGQPEATAGDITLNATGDIKVADSESRIRNLVREDSKGNGGNITIDSGSFSLGDGALLNASTYGQGNAGNVTVIAKNAVSLVGGDIYNNVETGGVGNSGGINIRGSSLSLTDGAQLQSGIRGADTDEVAGRGNGGSININLTGALTISGTKDGSASAIFTDVETGARGNGGNIDISSGSFSLSDGAQLNTSTYGQGNAGNVTVGAKDAVSLVNSNIFSTVEAGGVGKGGNIDINAATLSLTDGAQLLTATREASATQPAGQGNAGNVNVKVTGAVNIVGQKNGFPSAIFSLVNTGTVGNGGNITIDSGDFSLSDGALLNASTLGVGNAGNVTVGAKNAISLANAYIFSTVEAGGVGKGGNIDINAATLSLTDGAKLVASTSGQGLDSPKSQGGNITLNTTGKVEVAGADSAIRSTLLSEGIGNGGNVFINSGSFLLRDGAEISASTYGQGNAGNVTVIAKDAVSLASSTIFNNVESGGVGNSGGINIRGSSLSLTDGAQLQSGILKADTDELAGQGNGGNVDINVTGAVTISGRKGGSASAIFTDVETGARGNGGNINISSGSFFLSDGAKLIASTSGQGNGGSVDINLTGALTISGTKDGSASAIFTDVETGARGNGGNINISSGSFSLSDGARLVASTAGQGLDSPKSQAGNITLNTTGKAEVVGSNSAIRSTLLTGGVGNGGNIFIDSGDFSLSDGAQLSASTLGVGNAGNVTVGAKNAVDLANSNIFSTVEAGGVGKGGNIDINAATLSLTDGAQLLTATREASATQPAGQGNAGNVNVKVTGAVNIVGQKNGFPSAIFSLVNTGTVGNGGNITIDSGDFSLSDGALLNASTSGVGNAGNVTVGAKNAVDLANSNIFSTVEAGGVGKGGNIDINAATLSLTDGAQLLTATREASATQPAGQGNAGNVNVKVTGTVDIAGQKNGFPSAIFSFVNTGTVGNGGNIFIDSSDFSLSDGARLSASTYGQGNAGNVTVRAKNAVDLVNSNIFSTVEAGGVGKGGNIDINAATLSLTDGAQLLTATREASATQPAGQGNAGNVNVKVTGAVNIVGQKNGFPSAIFSLVNTGTVGNGGNIFIDSGDFSLSDGARLVASTLGQGNAGNVTVGAKNAVDLANGYILSTVEAGGVGKGGNIDINAATLSLTDGALLVASTFGQGNAGNVRINAKDTVTVSGTNQETGLSSALFTFTDSNSQGKGGDINVNTNIFHVSDGALLDARTTNNQKGGDITVNANVFEALNGGQLTSTTSSNGRAGKITVNATDKVIISGIDPSYSDRITKFPDNVLNIDANSGLFVNSKGSGITGDIEINSPKITLDNQGKLNAESASGNGGNINANSDFLLLRHGAQISTNAGTEKLGGNGGNININSKFIVAVPKENSDISANAFTGTGGNIQINSQGIFGIESRPKLTEKSDITASSELGVSGVTNINTPDNSSIQNSFTGLSPNVIDTNALIANSCISRATKRQENSFTITGSGALRYTPGDVLTSAYTTGDVRSVEPTPRPWKKGDPIIEPQGLYRLPNGQLILSRSCSN
ncbi:filamentous hemagglutinin N-terminal domain-containing protein [Nostoc sp. ChiQUE01b]|uniref:two-partner secretion domain-containing protein n=1 Tax=Nostoc sp. ChiQUE01b TaxID=3075376 RepID=UPI002AD2EE14|nr:filamentous hemagglutinin N-terminal domain-containing protein [Nostoc sp. ChiQUE01b]MDZ8262593.1 filamentous hemagglutinin N-terminal domain-containing protein [Nostoc sp. ChiQUE01b]